MELLENVLGGSLAVMAVLTVLLLIACHAVPRLVLPYHSLPWAFDFGRVADMDLHCTLYAVYHSTRFGRFSHLLFPLDVLAWFVLLSLWHPALLLLLLACLFVLASRVHDRTIGLGMALAWGALAALAWLCAHTLGAAAALPAEAILLGSTALRTASHIGEPVPPMVGAPVDRFRTLDEARLGPQALLIGAVGFVSEFAAGLPWGVFRVHAAWVVDWLRHGGRAAAWRTVCDRALAIRSQGWRIYPPVAELLRPYW